MPDFLLIGTKRGGTTALYFHLLEHPQVAPLFPSGRRMPLKANDTKGVHYFDTEAGAHSLAWYRSHMPSRLSRAARERRVGAPVVVGEASPYYLFHPLAAERAAAAVPHAKLIVLLRDPVVRAHSHYRERIRSNAEPLSFEEALAAEPERIAGEEQRLIADPRYRSYPHEQQSYATQGEYARALRRWLDRFPRESFVFLSSEEYYADPQRTYDTLTDALGLNRHQLADSRPRNAAPGASLSRPTARTLAERFEGPNAELERLLGRSFGWLTPATVDSTIRAEDAAAVAAPTS